MLPPTDPRENDANRLGLMTRLTYSFKSLFERIGQNMVDLVVDDMESATPVKSPSPRYRPLGVFLAGAVIGASGVLGTLKISAAHNSSDEAAAALIRERAAETPTLTPVAAIDLPLGRDESAETVETEQAENESTPIEQPKADEIESYTLKPRQNLSVVLRSGGLSAREIYLVTDALSEVLDLKRIQVGDKIEIGKTDTDSDKKELLSVTVEDRRGNRYSAVKVEPEVFATSLIEPEVDLKTEYAQGEIDGAFVTNAKQAGIPTNVISQIVWAFDGPVDFSRDLRKGDSFTAVFQKEYNKDGQPTGNGALVYASIDTRAKKHERYLYKDAQEREDYYDETGKVARKLFTIHPLTRQRITSKFGQRKHPVLGYTLTHWGVDYGMPHGSPIRAPGEGTITQVKRGGSYGLYIQIKHNSEYSTAYAHMSEFHKNSKVGRKVKAGDVIGYVGSTGRSTGPHLHWELIKNGKKINPTTQRITAQRKLKGEELERFYAERDRIRGNVTDGEIAYARAEALPEARKMAYQGEPKKVKKIARRKSRPQKTASRLKRRHNGG